MARTKMNPTIASTIAAGPINTMKTLQLALHQHGASISIVVDLAKRANTHELEHLQVQINKEMVSP